MNNEFELISAKETADLLDICLNSFYTLLRNDPTFPAIQVNRKWKIIKNKIPDWCDQQLNNKNFVQANYTLHSANARKE